MSIIIKQMFHCYDIVQWIPCAYLWPECCFVPYAFWNHKGHWIAKPICISVIWLAFQHKTLLIIIYMLFHPFSSIGWGLWIMKRKSLVRIFSSPFPRGQRTLNKKKKLGDRQLRLQYCTIVISQLNNQEIYFLNELIGCLLT